MALNATDVNLLIEQVCSQVIANGSNSTLYSTIATIASVLLIPGSHLLVQLYDRIKYGPSGNTPAQKPSA